jgi:hypothetical protein
MRISRLIQAFFTFLCLPEFHANSQVSSRVPTAAQRLLLPHLVASTSFPIALSASLSSSTFQHALLSSTIARSLSWTVTRGIEGAGGAPSSLLPSLHFIFLLPLLHQKTPLPRPCPPPLTSRTSSSPAPVATSVPSSSTRSSMRSLRHRPHSPFLVFHHPRDRQGRHCQLQRRSDPRKRRRRYRRCRRPPAAWRGSRQPHLCQ